MRPRILSSLANLFYIASPAIAQKKLTLRELVRYRTLNSDLLDLLLIAGGWRLHPERFYYLASGNSKPGMLLLANTLRRTGQQATYFTTDVVYF